MELSVTTSEGHNGEKRPNEALNRMSINSRMRKRFSKKQKRRLKRLSEQYLGSFIQGVCEDRTRLQPKVNGRNVLEQTIDISEDDSSVNCSNLNVLMFQSPANKTLIDLSKDFPSQSEVIDLTVEIHDKKIPSEPTVIDITKEDSTENPNTKPETNDEVSVIGTFRAKNSNLSNITQLSSRVSNFNSIIRCSEKLRRKYLRKRFRLDKIGSRCVKECGKGISKQKQTLAKLENIGKNIYVNSPISLPSQGLRPIIIDGSNVAFVHSSCNFCCKRLEICINYFKKKGHKVTAFVPQFRINCNKSDNPQLLRKLERQGDVVLTPSKKVDGRNIVPYDDRFIVQTAVLKGGIIVTRDNYNDLLQENPAWAETIKYRTLPFTWVDDVLMFPKDPLGEYGPSLEDFLRFN